MYQVIYHDGVQEDLKSLTRKDQQKIISAIEKKLFTRPDYFGKPLRKELKGYYRLRVEHYRIVYQVQKNKILVFVIHIGQRKDSKVYEEALRRIMHLP